MELALFDLDGVLVQPGGYRAAVRATIAVFLNEWGLPTHWLPEEEDLLTFEAQGISGEWDMIPLWLCLVAENVTRLAGTLEDVSQAAALAGHAPRPDFKPAIRAFRPLLQPGTPPSERVLAAARAGGAGSPFPTLAGSPLLEELLGHTRTVEACRTTQVLQAFIVGDAAYEQTWNLPSPVRSQPFLALHDRSLLAPEAAARLLSLQAEGRLGLAAMTARPSSAPDGKHTRQVGYTPEAESALRTAGLVQIPLVGYGSLQSVAERAAFRSDRLLKPAPFQALASMAAAAGFSVSSALEWAYAVLSVVGELPEHPAFPPLADLALPFHSGTVVHIFEDSAIGIRSLLEAVEHVRPVGLEVVVRAHGIASNLDKKTALESVGAVVHPEVNQALRATWPAWF
jgi:phosphoglycolate phosphatase-like HAD superfamily hydrolase